MRSTAEKPTRRSRHALSSSLAPPARVDASFLQSLENFTPIESRARRFGFSASEWSSLFRFYGIIVALHIIGCGLFLHYSQGYPALVGLGFVAYMFGLRHAFDADHIAAVDDTVRYLMQKGRRPLGVGFFFSLGHSTVVLALAVAVTVAAASVKQDLPMLKNFGSVIGAGVSGTFLWIIGILNLLVLLDIFKVWNGTKRQTHSHVHLDQLMARRGLVNRLLGGRFQKIISHSWQMYPLGLLFGLGFDTASEIGLLALTASASAGNLPVVAVLSLPILFMAGMSLMDTTDGVLMSKAYGWALINPSRKIVYNLTITSVSVIVGLVIGTIELMQVLIHITDIRGDLFDFVSGLDFGLLGYLVVGVFMIAWGLSFTLWKFRRPQLA